MKADVSLAVSGIAGPGGGTAEKPVGTTWIGLVTGEGELAQLFHFSSGDREKNKALAVDAAFQLLLDYLQND
jgi:nicotinamide mononucleotide (NMN) deamidase PncC